MEDPFAVGRSICDQTSNMGMNGLWAHTNVISLMILYMVRAVGQQQMKRELENSPNGQQVYALLADYRARLAKKLADDDMDFVLDDVVETWEVQDEDGNFASMEGVPCPASKRYKLLPSGAVVSCKPENTDKLESILRQVAFEKVISDKVHEMMDAEGITKPEHLKRVVDGREVRLREYLGTHHPGLVEDVANFLKGFFVNQ